MTLRAATVAGLGLMLALPPGRGWAEPGPEAQPTPDWTAPAPGTSLTLSGRRLSAEGDLSTGYLTQQVAAVAGEVVTVVEAGGAAGPLQVDLWRGMVPLSVELLGLQPRTRIETRIDPEALQALFPLSPGRSLLLPVEEVLVPAAAGMQPLAFDLALQVEAPVTVAVGSEQIACWRLMLERRGREDLQGESRIDWCPQVGLVLRSETTRSAPQRAEVIRLVPIELDRP